MRQFYSLQNVLRQGWLWAVLLLIGGGTGHELLQAQPVDSMTSAQERYERLYVPEQDFGQLLTVRSGVLLTTEKFDELLQQAEKSLAEQKDQPEGFVLEAVRYEVTLAGDVLKIVARCQLTKLSAGWAELPLPLDGVALKQALLAGKPAPLGLSGSPAQVRLLANFVGQQELELHLTTPIHRAGTDELASFSVFPPTAATLQMTLPPGRVLQLNGSETGTLSTQATTETAEQQRKLSLPVGGWKTVQLRLSDATSQSTEESLVFAHTEYQALVNQDSVNWQARCFLDVFGKRLNRLVFSVPSQLELTNVQAPGLQAWELQSDTEQAERTQVVLTFREAISERIPIVLQGVQLLENRENWRLATLQLQGATSHTGTLLLGSLPATRLKTSPVQGIRPSVESIKPPEAVRSQYRFQTYDIWEEDFVLELSVAEMNREVQAAVSHVLNIEEIDVQLSSVITLQTFFSPLFEFTVELPGQWQPEQIRQESGEIDWQPISREAGQHRLRIPVNPPLKPGEKRTFWITSQLNRESATFSLQPQEFPLPTLKMADVNILEGSYVITASPLLHVVPVDVTGMDPAFLGLERERFGFRYQDSVIGGSLQVTRKPARFNSSTVQLAAIDENQLHLTFHTTLEVSGGGLREVSIQLSPLAELPGEFQSLSDVRITEQSRQQTEQGQLWKLTFDRFVTGQIPLKLEMWLPRPDTPEISLPELLVQQTDLQEQFLLLAAEDDQLIELQLTDAAGLRVEPIDPADWPAVSSQTRRRIVAGYHLTQPGLQARLTLQQFDSQPIPMAIGQELLLTSLLPLSGSLQQEAELRFVSAGVQSLLVELPEQATLWSAILNDQPITARQNERGVLISLAGEQQAGALQRLTILYGVEAQSQPTSPLTTQVLPAPRFSVKDGRGESQPLKIMLTDWLLHHTPQTRIEPTAPGVERVSATVDDTWFNRLQQAIFRQSGLAIAANLLTGLLILGVALVIVRFLKARLGWHRLVLMPVGCLGVCLLLLVGAFALRIQMQERAYHARETQIATADSPPPEAEYPSYAAPAEPDPFNPFGDSKGVAARLHGLEDDLLSERAKRERNVPNPAFAPEGMFKSAPQSLGFDRRQLNEATIQPAPNRPVPPAAPAMVESDKENVDLRRAGKKVEPPVQAKAVDGLLSLQLTMQMPDQLQTTHLRTFGEQEQPGLSIRYYSEAGVARLRWLIVAGMLLLFWLLRGSSRTAKFSLAVVVFGIPLLFLGVVPLLLLPIAEALLLGGIAGLLLWFGLWLAQCLSLFCQKTCSSRITSWHTAAPLLLIVLSLASPASAQEKPAARLAVTTPQVVESPPKIPLIFPFDASKSPLTAERVLVPEAEYLRLWKLAHPEEISSSAPQPTQIQEATYLAEFVPAASAGEKPAISVQARFVMANFRSSAQLVELPLGDVVLESLEINGKAIAATIDEQGKSAVLLAEQGVHVVDVRFRVPVDVFGAAGQFKLDLSAVAAGNFSFRLPDDNVQVQFNAGKLPFELIEQEGQKYADVALGAAQTYHISWQPRVASTQMQFLSCESQREVLVQPRGVELQYVFNFQIAQGSFSEVEFEIPAGVKLKSLSGADVSGWQAVAQGRLRVLLKQAIEKQTRMTVSLYVPLPGGEPNQALTLPDLVPLGVTREMTTWGLQWPSHLNVQVQTSAGGRQLPNQSFQPKSAKPLVLEPQRVFRFTERPQQIQLEVSDQPARLNAQHYTLVDIQPHKTHLASLVEIQVQGQLRQSLEFSLPRNLQIVELSATDLADWFITPAENEGAEEARLTVLFNGPQQGAVQVLARGHIQQPALQQAGLSLLGLQLREAERSTTYLGLGANQILGFTWNPPADWLKVDPTKLPDALQKIANFPLRAGLVSQAPQPAPVTVTLHREQAQLKANSVTLVAVSAASIDYGLSLQWTVASAAADRFSFAGPSWLAERIEFDSPDIRQIQSQAISEEQTLWTIESKTPQTGEFLVTAVVTLPQPADRQVSVPALQFFAAGTPADKAAQPAPVPLEIQSHYAVLVNLGQAPLEPVSDHARQLVRQSELPIRLPSTLVQQAMEILRINPASIPRWELKPLAQQETPAATISLAELTTVIDGAGHWRTVAVYHVKNRQRQFLPVILPADSRLLSVLVNKKPARAVSRTVSGQEISCVPLPTAGAADLSFPVQLVLEGQLDHPLMPRWGLQRLSLPSPNILSTEVSAEFGIPVLHTVWKLSTPEELSLRPIMGKRTNMTPVNRQEVERLNWQNRLQEMLSLSEIVSLKGGSYQKRQRAAENLQELKDDLLHSSTDSMGGLEIQKQQAQVFQQVEEKLQQLEQEKTPAAGLSDQSLGRAYILNNNGMIRDENTDQLSSQSGVQRDFRVQTAPDNNLSRRALPPQGEASFRNLELKAKADAKPQSEQRSSINRKELLEENLRQNTLSYSQQTPSSGKQQSNQRHTIMNKTQIDIGAAGNGLGMGEGFGMGGGIMENENSPVAAAAPVVPTEWTSTGGVSLNIEVPQFEQLQLFSKVGGSPELLIEVHSRNLLKQIAGWGWSLLVAGLLFWLLLRIPRLLAGEYRMTLAILLLLSGLGSFALLPGLLPWLVLLLAGAVGLFFLSTAQQNPRTAK